MISKHDSTKWVTLPTFLILVLIASSLTLSWMMFLAWLGFELSSLNLYLLISLLLRRGSVFLSVGLVKEYEIYFHHTKSVVTLSSLKLKSVFRSAWLSKRASKQVRS